jgi:hypothetical protein
MADVLSPLSFAPWPSASQAHHDAANMTNLTSAAGLVGFLSESDSDLRSFALHRLDEDIDLLWPEVSNSISIMLVLLLVSHDAATPRCRRAC